MRRHWNFLLEAAAAACFAWLVPACGDQCNRASDCNVGEVCNQGVCQASIAKASHCVVDSDCAPGFACSSGVCSPKSGGVVSQSDGGTSDAGMFNLPDGGTTAHDAGMGVDGGPVAPPPGPPIACTTTSSAPTNWGSVPSALSSTITAVYTHCANDAWAATALNVQHWDGVQWSARPLPRANVFIDRIWGTDSNDVWLVGKLGLILHWNGNGFVDFTGAGGTQQVELFDVHGRSANDFYVAGGGATLLHYDGVSFRKVMGVAETTRDITTVYVRGQNDVWIGGGEGPHVSCFLNHFNGTIWTTVDCGTAAPVRRMSGSGTEVFVTFYDDVVAQTSSVATPVAATGAPNAIDLFVASATVAYAPTQTSINLFDGSMWNTVGPAAFSMHGIGAIGGSSGRDIWIGRSDGRMFHGPSLARRRPRGLRASSRPGAPSPDSRLLRCRRRGTYRRWRRG